MNFDLTDAHKTIQEEMAFFCRAYIAPAAERLDTAAPSEANALIRSLFEKLAETRYFRTLLSEDLMAQCVMGEEVAKASSALFLTAMSSLTAFGRAIALFGTDDQKKRYLPDIASGRKIGCLACTEPAAGSDLSAMTSTATRQENSWFLDGKKAFVTNAPLADTFLILCWMNREAGLTGDTGFFRVDRGTPGLVVGDPMETMGLRGLPLAEVTLHQCRVDSDALLGAEAGQGFRQWTLLSEYIKLSLSSLAVGIGMACMEDAVAYAKSRKAFGKPIGLFEGVGAKLAMMFTHNDLGRLMAYRAARAMENREPESPILTACAKLFTSEGLNETADLAMQVHGGHGFLKGTTVERLYRDARFAALAYGTSEMQRAAIARDSLDRYQSA